MKLTIDMPWERDLSVNHCRFGAGGGYRKKPHVQDWMTLLSWRTTVGSGFITSAKMPSWEASSMTIHVKVDFRYPDKRRRDDHNFYKVIADAVAGGLDIDDKDIRISTGTVEMDQENPGFTITVEDEG